jgi:hypothetical protein
MIEIALNISKFQILTKVVRIRCYFLHHIHVYKSNIYNLAAVNESNYGNSGKNQHHHQDFGFR